MNLDRWRLMALSLAGVPLPPWHGPTTRHVCSDAQAAVEPNDAGPADEGKQHAAV